MTNQTNHINKTAIITGASRGIGAAIAKKFASCGYNLSLCCRSSSDTLKELLFSGILPPAILMRKEISAMILSTLFPNRFENFPKICNDLFPNVGLLEDRTQNDFYLDLMGLYQTTSLT